MYNVNKIKNDLIQLLSRKALVSDDTLRFLDEWIENKHEEYSYDDCKYIWSLVFNNISIDNNDSGLLYRITNKRREGYFVSFTDNKDVINKFYFSINNAYTEKAVVLVGRKDKIKYYPLYKVIDNIVNDDLGYYISKILVNKEYECVCEDSSEIKELTINDFFDN